MTETGVYPCVCGCFLLTAFPALRVDDIKITRSVITNKHATVYNHITPVCGQIL